MKKRLVCILSLLTAGIIFGYLFFASWLLGFLVTKFAAGKVGGKQGKVKSIVIPFGKYRVHFHHWLISLGIIIFGLVINICFLTPAIFYGLLSGPVFQGIYCYSDWHKILITRGYQNIENTAVCHTEYLLEEKGWERT